ncbi:LPXTG cell wall anchor domain-containing protein [Virgisporangium aliadipatigenens]|nr:LPXTG cell wall anchor domain-containing protein [Virgisporangium aliadipatigenens]
MRSTGLEPAAGEVTAVYAAMIAGLILVLGLLAALMWRRRQPGCSWRTCW